MAQLTLGQVLEYQGDIRRASLDYGHIWRYRASYFGPDNPMAVWARCAMASIYRKLGQYDTEARRGHGATQVANARLHIALTPYYHSTIKKNPKNKTNELINYITNTL
jgi:hypothetical protein